MEMYENKAIMQGIIIRKSITDKLGSAVIATTRKGVSKDANTPCIHFFNDMKEDLKSYNVGDFVYIEGEIQDYVDKNNKKRQGIAATKIQQAKSRIEELYGASGGSLIDKKNEIRLMGTVLGVQETERVWNIFLRTVSNGHTHRIIVKLYKIHDTQKIGESIKKGDSLCIIGTLQTKKRQTKDNSMLFFENVVAMEVSHLA